MKPPRPTTEPFRFALPCLTALPHRGGDNHGPFLFQTFQSETGVLRGPKIPKFLTLLRESQIKRLLGFVSMTYISGFIILTEYALTDGIASRMNIDGHEGTSYTHS